LQKAIFNTGMQEQADTNIQDSSQIWQSFFYRLGAKKSFDMGESCYFIIAIVLALSAI
jgi:hypothetical protein